MNRFSRNKRKLHLPAALILSVLIFAVFTVPASAAPVTGSSGEAQKWHLPFAQKVKSSQIKNDKVIVESIEYDRKSRTVEFEFQGSVKWKSPKVKITRKGRNYAKKIQGKDSDSLTVKVKKLTYGATYSYKITGVKNKKGKKYQTVKGTFTAVED